MGEFAKEMEEEGIMRVEKEIDGEGKEQVMVKMEDKREKKKEQGETREQKRERERKWEEKEVERRIKEAKKAESNQKIHKYEEEKGDKFEGEVTMTTVAIKPQV